MEGLMETIREGLDDAVYFCKRQAEKIYSYGDGTTAVEYWKTRAGKYQEILDRDDLVVMPRKVFSFIEGRGIGRAAETIVQHLTGANLLESDDPQYFPADEEDFARCDRLLRAFPELRERLPEMAAVSEKWADLVSHWEDLSRHYTD